GRVVSGLFFSLSVSNVSTAGTSNLGECPLQPNPTQCNSALTAAKLDIQLAVGAGIPGAIFLAGGIVLFIVGGNKPATSAWNITPIVGPKLAGLSFNASF